jgi:hypothetical protein
MLIVYGLIWHQVRIISILISIGTFVVTYVTQQRSKQFRIALDINDRLIETANRSAEFAGEPHYAHQIKIQKKWRDLQYLTTLEPFSFLVRKKEITNKNIINYFKPLMISQTQRIFKDHPDVARRRKRSRNY